MIDYEKLGVFYMGRELDPATRARTSKPYLYDAKTSPLTPSSSA